jgi:flagellar biosynthetic protein FlhB
MAEQKTEKPTQHRLQKARKEGKFPTSRDLVSAVQLAVALLVVLNAGQEVFRQIEKLFIDLLRYAFSPSELTPTDLVALCRLRLWPVFEVILKEAAIVAGLTVFIHVLSTGFGLATKQFAPAFSKLFNLSRIQQLPQQNFSAMLKAIFLLPVIVFVVYVEISGQLSQVANLSVMGLNSALAQARDMIVTLLERLTLALFVIGVIDFIRQRQRFQSSMRMTKQETRDEAKEMEGNVEMKMRIRRLQRAAARRSMLKTLPKATAVIVNPTHYAIALQYEMNSKSVPKVVAKGKNYLAQLIRKMATQHDIPIVENKPLAQALYQAADVGQEIPPHLYRAVAEVLAYLYRTLNRR